MSVLFGIRSEKNKSVDNQYRRMHIRPAQASDEKEYIRLERLFTQEHGTLEESAFRISAIEPLLIGRNFRKKLRRKKKLFLVLDDGKRLQGYFFGDLSRNKIERLGYLHKRTTYGYIENVFITKPHRGKGSFRAFMEQFFTFLEKQNVHHCELHVNVKNEGALRAYERYGFRPIEYKMRRTL